MKKRTKSMKKQAMVQRLEQTSQESKRKEFSLFTFVQKSIGNQIRCNSQKQTKFTLNLGRLMATNSQMLASL